MHRQGEGGLQGKQCTACGKRQTFRKLTPPKEEAREEGGSYRPQGSLVCV